MYQSSLMPMHREPARSITREMQMLTRVLLGQAA